MLFNCTNVRLKSILRANGVGFLAQLFPKFLRGCLLFRQFCRKFLIFCFLVEISRTLQRFFDARRLHFVHPVSKIAFIRLHVASFVFFSGCFFVCFCALHGKLFLLCSFFAFLLCLPARLYLFACLCALPFCAVEWFFVCLRVYFCVRVRSEKLTKLLFC